MRTTSVSGASVFTARSSSSPLIPGIMRSVTTTDARSLRSASSAAGPLRASATRHPSRSKILASDSRFEVSSSTMSTRGATAGRIRRGAPGGLPRWGRGRARGRGGRRPHPERGAELVPERDRDARGDGDEDGGHDRPLHETLLHMEHSGEGEPGAQPGCRSPPQLGCASSAEAELGSPRKKAKRRPRGRRSCSSRSYDALLGLRLGGRGGRRDLGLLRLRLAGLGPLGGPVLLRRLGLLRGGGGDGLELGLRGAGCRRRGVAGLELLDPARGVHELLLAGEERVAVRADLDVEVAARRAGLDDVPAVAHDLRGLVVGVDRFLHDVLLAACTGRAERAVVRASQWEPRDLVGTRGSVKVGVYFPPPTIILKNSSWLFTWRNLSRMNFIASTLSSPFRIVWRRM